MLFAGLVFALLYGIALRLYVYMRAGRDDDRWHPRAVVVAALLGGFAFYLAGQLRSPYVPRWMDLPAFFILSVAAAAIPLILELRIVPRARTLRRASGFELPSSSGPPLPHEEADP